MKSKTDWDKLKNISDSEIEKVANNDPDVAIVSKKDLKQFKKVNPMDEIEVVHKALEG